MKHRLAWLLVILLLVISPSLAQDTNLADACVEAYDPDMDYFPDKAEVTRAEGFEIEYFNHYKVVRTLIPYPGAEEPAEYVLVQCGTPAPEGYDDVPMVEVPVDSFVALSTTQLPHLDALGRLDSLIALDSFLYAYTPDVIEMIEAGELVEVGASFNINVEVVLDLEPDVVISHGFNPDTDAHPVLANAGVFSVINSEWLEPTLLGRAEWVKFTGAFFNEEARATEVFDDIVSQYEATSEIARSVPQEERVTALWNTPFNDAWTIPSHESWVGQLLTDAGVNWVLMDEAGGVNQDFSFEAVYEAGFDAPVWVTNAFQVSTLDQLAALDARYADFAAFQSGEVYNNNARENANGGNDFWETGVTNPHLLLMDLVALFYPDLMPGHELVFYQKLG